MFPFTTDFPASKISLKSNENLKQTDITPPAELEVKLICIMNNNGN